MGEGGDGPDDDLGALSVKELGRGSTGAVDRRQEAFPVEARDQAAEKGPIGKRCRQALRRGEMRDTRRQQQVALWSPPDVGIELQQEEPNPWVLAD